MPSRIEIAVAIQQLRQEIRWRPGRAQAHVEKRIRLGHIPVQSTVADYELIIRSVVNDASADVYLFQHGNRFYPTVVADLAGTCWLVMCGMDGVMETAFPPDDPNSYFQNDKYQLYGVLREVLT